MPVSTLNNRPLRYWNSGLLFFVLAWLAIYSAVTPDPVALFEQNALFIPIGFGAALLGNLSAIGGGIIFIPAMIFIFHLPPVTALKVALGSQCFGMSSGAIAWFRLRAIPLRELKLTVPGLLLGSFVSSVIIRPNPILVKGLFGPVSVALGVLTLYLSRRPKEISPPFAIPDSARLTVFAVSFIGGMITGWVAIGEGEVVAALLMLRYGLDPSACIGLGVMLLAINSIFLVLIHQIHLGGIPWEIVGFTGLGCVFGARLGPFLGQSMKSQSLLRFFALVAIGDGLLFVYQFVRTIHQ